MKIVQVNKRGATLGFIFITIFIDILGLGIIVPVLPKLLETLGHVDVSRASEYSGWLTFTYALMQFICSPLLGNLSDRFGRRPVLLASLFGFGIDYLFMAFAPTIAWLFVGRFIAGIAGASTTTASAYIADISTGDKRSADFGLIGAASGAGFIMGIGLGGYLGDISLKLPFMAAAAFALLNAIYGLFVLPESLAPEHRRKFEWSRANPRGAFKNMVNHSVLAGLATAFALVYIGQKAVEYLLSFFITEKFNWSLSRISTLGIYIGALIVSIQGGLIRWIIPKLGQKPSIIYGLCCYAIGLLLIAFFTFNGWLLYAYMIPYCLGGVSGAALQGLITSKVGPKEQGELQGTLSSINSISIVIGPLVMSYIFHYFTGRSAIINFPGAPYLFGALLMIISIVIVTRSFNREKVQH